MSMSMGWKGMSEFRAAIDRVGAGAVSAAKQTLVQSAATVIRKAQGNFEGAHPKGMPHIGGDKPNIVTGYLRRSIRMNPVVSLGLGFFGTQVGPDAIYGRRIELGFNGSKAYPYFQPAVDEASKEFPAIAAASWSTFMR